MSGSLRVFHCQAGSSDKIWAISTRVNEQGQYNVWYGRRNNTLTHDTVPAEESCSKRIQKKLDKGYVEKSNLTIDMGKRKAVLKTAANTQPPEPEAAPETGSLWFTIGAKVDTASVDDYLDDAIINLSTLDADEAAYLQGTEAYKAISTHERQGEIEFKEGPLGLLLIFGLRRFIASEETQGSGGDIPIADDDGQLISDDFERLEQAIRAANGEYLVSGNGSKEHYSSLKAIRQYAIALGCIDAPIDLSAIAADTTAAFF